MNHQGPALLASNTRLKAGIHLEQSFRNFAKNGKILRAVILVNLRSILAELHIKMPMKVVFDTPMSANQFGKALGIILGAANVV